MTYLVNCRAYMTAAYVSPMVPHKAPSFPYLMDSHVVLTLVIGIIFLIHMVTLEENFDLTTTP